MSDPKPLSDAELDALRPRIAAHNQDYIQPSRLLATIDALATITGEMLRGACKEQREVFVQEWPDGAEVTIENVLRAVELGLHLSWGTKKWFTPEAKAKYWRGRTPIREAYLRQIAPIREANERQLAAIWLDYQRQHAALWLEAFMASALNSYGTGASVASQLAVICPRECPSPNTEHCRGWLTNGRAQCWHCGRWMPLDEIIDLPLEREAMKALEATNGDV